jgi:putative SOS response-associated peptidase YedK
LSSPGEVLAELFELVEMPEITPRYNIAPTQSVVAVHASEGAGRHGEMMHWGLIPSWADDPAIGARMINARAETVATKPSFRSAFRQRRCLVAADGFYEWQKLERRKQPHYIRLRDGRPFAFAGLWENWESRDSASTPASVRSCTIITTEPNELVAPLHNRMPVILHARDYDAWLAPDTRPVDTLGRLLRPYPADEMEASPVSTRVNKPSNDSPECIEPIRTGQS